MMQEVCTVASKIQFDAPVFHLTLELAENQVLWTPSKTCFDGFSKAAVIGGIKASLLCMFLGFCVA